MMLGKTEVAAWFFIFYWTGGLGEDVASKSSHIINRSRSFRSTLSKTLASTMSNQTPVITSSLSRSDPVCATSVPDILQYVASQDA